MSSVEYACAVLVIVGIGGFIVRVWIRLRRGQCVRCATPVEKGVRICAKCGYVRWEE